MHSAAQAPSVVPSPPDVLPAAIGACPASEDGGRGGSPATHPPARPVCRTFRGEASQVPLARRFARRYLAERHACPEPVIGDILLCVTEIAANAVQHTASGLEGHFTVVLCASRQGVRVEVIDDGPAVAARHRRAGGDDDFAPPGGLGLRLVSAHCDRMGYAEKGQRGVSWFERAWDAEPRADAGQ